MDAEGDDLKQYEPVPDALILAAVERAMRHGTPEVWIAGVVEHLGFRFSASMPARSAATSNASPHPRTGTSAEASGTRATTGP